MSGLWGHLVGVWILVLMLVFLGIWYWAWRPRHRRTFDALARVPMLEDCDEPEAGEDASVPDALRASDALRAPDALRETAPHAGGRRTS